MFRPDFVGRYVLVLGRASARKNCARRYSIVFFSTSGARAIKLASLLSVAGIRVHRAATSAELHNLLRLTSAGVVLIDMEAVGTCGTVLRELAADFPDVVAVALARCNTESAARLRDEGAWRVVVEPARYFDLLSALESAQEMHQELTDPERLRARVDTTMMAIRQAAQADIATPKTSSQAAAAGVLTICVIRLPGPLD